MKMGSFEHLSPRDVISEQEKNEFRQVLKHEVEEYAKGIDPAIQVETKTPDYDDDKYLPNSFRFIFRYNGEETAFTDEDINEETLPAVQKTLTQFYLKSNKFKA